MKTTGRIDYVPVTVRTKYLSNIGHEPFRSVDTLGFRLVISMIRTLHVLGLRTVLQCLLRELKGNVTKSLRVPLQTGFTTFVI
jgi:hypothetical protein